MGLLAYWIINTIRYKMKPSVVAVFFLPTPKVVLCGKSYVPLQPVNKRAQKKNGFIISI